MKNILLSVYYRVDKNGTSVTKVSANNFKPVVAKGFKRGLPVDHSNGEKSSFIFSYALPPDEEMYYGYSTQALAMQKAKEGALNYIAHMIRKVELGIKKLRQYRIDHYEDLNSTLLEANIRNLEREMHIK